MPTSPSIMDTRRDQMFPVLEPFEIERVRRFGKVRSYDDGATLAKVGEVGPGLTIILAGQVEIVRRDELGHSTPMSAQIASTHACIVSAICGGSASTTS